MRLRLLFLVRLPIFFIHEAPVPDFSTSVSGIANQDTLGDRTKQYFSVLIASS